MATDRAGAERANGTACNGDVELVYRVLGDSDAQPVLLICGNGTQMLHWPPELVAGLTGNGLQIAMFDNRDSGSSTHCADLPAYDLRDLARDAVAVLDAIGWSAAHVVGVSLGGMIGQVMAVQHPDRVRTLTSISAAPGWGLRISRPRLRTVVKIIGLARRAGEGREAAADHAVHLFRLIGAPGQALDEAWLREVAVLAYDIDHDPTAGQRQLAACKASGDRRSELSQVTAPTLVVHGQQDPMQSIKAGKATAAAIPGSRFLAIPGAGHVLPPDAWSAVVQAITDLVSRARETRLPAPGH